MILSRFEQVASGQLPREHHTLKGAISFLVHSLSAIGSGMPVFGTSLKVRRMEAALGNLSDQQLAVIGIKRGEIKRHANYIVGYKYDGL